MRARENSGEGREISTWRDSGERERGPAHGRNAAATPSHSSCHIIYYFLLSRPTPSCRLIVDMSTQFFELDSTRRLPNKALVSPCKILFVPLLMDLNFDAFEFKPLLNHGASLESNNFAVAEKECYGD
jgi:hypothetical protein